MICSWLLTVFLAMIIGVEGEVAGVVPLSFVWAAALLGTLLLDTLLRWRANRKLTPFKRAWLRRFEDTEFLLGLIGKDVLDPIERDFIGQGWGKISSRAAIPREKAELIGYVMKIGSLFVAEMVYTGKLAHGSLDAGGKTTLLIGPTVFDAAEKKYPLDDFNTSDTHRASNLYVVGDLPRRNNDGTRIRRRPASLEREEERFTN